MLVVTYSHSPSLRFGVHLTVVIHFVHEPAVTVPEPEQTLRGLVAVTWGTQPRVRVRPRVKVTTTLRWLPLVTNHR